MRHQPDAFYPPPGIPSTSCNVSFRQSLLDSTVRRRCLRREAHQEQRESSLRGDVCAASCDGCRGPPFRWCLLSSRLSVSSLFAFALYDEPEILRYAMSLICHRVLTSDRPPTSYAIDITSAGNLPPSCRPSSTAAPSSA